MNHSFGLPRLRIHQVPPPNRSPTSPPPPFECRGPSDPSRTYALRSPLEKLEYQFELTTFDLATLETKVPYVVAPWQKPPIINIAKDETAARISHNRVVRANPSQIFYTDGSGMNGRIATAAIKTLQIMDNMEPMITNQKSACLGTDVDHTIYLGKAAWNMPCPGDDRGRSKTHHHLHGQSSSNPGNLSTPRTPQASTK